MPTRFRSYQPDQALLLPPSLRDWLPEGHIANHVSDLVDGLDLSVFYERYEGDGRRKSPYEPRMMVKLLLYGYATGVFSSRKIARKLEEDVAFRVLAADNFPSHRTICEFRRRHLGDFRKLFVEVVGLARELGLVRFGKLSIDGTKVRANASKRKAMSDGRMRREERRLSEEIEGLLLRARETDAAEDARFGEALRGDELPEELRRREDRLAAIRAAKERLESRQREVDAARGREPGTKRNPKGGRPYKRDYGEPEETAQSNFTDPESGIMKTSSEGFQQCYNAQVAVSGENQLIVATEVSSNASDQGWILPLVEEVRTTFGEQPETVLADAGYCNEGDLAALEERVVDALCGAGSGRQTGGRGECGPVPGDGADGEETGDFGRPGAIRPTQVAVGSAQWLDQGNPRLPSIQPARADQSAGRVGSGLSGVERQADAKATGGLMPGNLDSTLTRTILNRADAGIWNLPLPEMPSGIPGCTFGRTSPVLRGAKRPTAQTPSLVHRH